MNKSLDQNVCIGTIIKITGETKTTRLMWWLVQIEIPEIVDRARHHCDIILVKIVDSPVRVGQDEPL